MIFRPGTAVWVEHPDLAWAEAEVVCTTLTGSSSPPAVTVVLSNGARVVADAWKVLLRDTEADLCGVDDMTKLIYLHEPGVLCNLAHRYALNEIYTYTGRILIAINPFAKLPHLYDMHMMEQYRGVQFGELSPHVFAIADASYRAMVGENCSQSILVSGESGAGKTETTKLIMRYLTFVGGRLDGNIRSVEQQVLESNPLLEAFGNARTVRNDNSRCAPHEQKQPSFLYAKSRFGKFVQIQFDKSGRISGAAIRTYLLERSRVVQISESERNYHCFYQLCASGQDADKYKLAHPRNFNYLNQSHTFELQGVSDAEEYLRTRRAMDIVGICFSDQEAIFRIVAAILHLGNIEFSPGDEFDSSAIKDEKCKFHLQMAADLLMVDASLLLSTLCFRKIKTPEGNIVKAVDNSSAVIGRDALAKTIYARLFDWIWSRGHRLGSWTSMVLSVLNITVLSSCVSTLLMKSFNSILISMFSRWSRRNTKQKKLIGAILNMLITKIYWILSKRSKLSKTEGTYKVTSRNVNSIPLKYGCLDNKLIFYLVHLISNRRTIGFSTIIKLWLCYFRHHIIWFHHVCRHI